MTGPTSTDAYRAIADPTRRALLERLAIEGQLCVGDLVEGHDLTFAAVSQHLQVLRRAKLVTERRVGRERHYSIDAAPLQDVARWLAFFATYWESKLDRLEAHLERKAASRKKGKLE